MTVFSSAQFYCKPSANFAKCEVQIMFSTMPKDNLKMKSHILCVPILMLVRILKLHIQFSKKTLQCPFQDRNKSVISYQTRELKPQTQHWLIQNFHNIHVICIWLLLVIHVAVYIHVLVNSYSTTLKNTSL